MVLDREIVRLCEHVGISRNVFVVRACCGIHADPSACFLVERSERVFEILVLLEVLDDVRDLADVSAIARVPLLLLLVPLRRVNIADGLVRLEERFEKTFRHFPGLFFPGFDGKDFLIVGVKTVIPVELLERFIIIVVLGKVEDGPTVRLPGVRE